MWLLILFSSLLPGAEGWEFTVRGTCRFEPVPGGVVLVDAANGRPLPGLEVELHFPSGKRGEKTDRAGRVPVSGGGWALVVHPGSGFHHPCRRFVVAPPLASRAGGFPWRYLGPMVGLALILAALWPVARARWRRREKIRQPVIPEEAPEVEFSPAASRTFVPWRRPGFHGHVLVWESGRPLPGVRVGFVEHGVEGDTATDEEGRFFLPAAACDVRFEKEGYHVVLVARPRGQVLVRLMSLPVRALWLLRQICRRHDRERYAKLSPRQALSRRIPPPEVIERLERLAYAGEAPEPGELERLERDLAPDGDG
jgi:hypothetical protein